MNQHRSLIKAAGLIRPVALAVASRRPVGMSYTTANRLQQRLTLVTDYLTDAIGYYDQAAKRKESR